MNEMNCNDCLRWLHGYLDDELDTTTATRIALHLEACPACRRAYEAQKSLKTDVKAYTPYYDAPDALTRSIFARLAPQPPNAAQNWLAPALSFTALAAAILLYVAVPRGENGWADEAVSEHVRSLMPGHLNDVASSDRHTVKPWFTGKLDFSPPVYDFTAQGYPLLGGRLDYLQHRTVAALSYRRNKHIINAFIFPTTQEDAALKSISDRGYNIVYWEQNHMRFVVVSDVNRGELTTLAQLMQKGL